MQTLDQILQDATSAIQSAADLKSLDHYRVQYLGKKGQLTEYLKTLGQLLPEDRPAAGQKINTIKEHHSNTDRATYFRIEASCC